MFETDKKQELDTQLTANRRLLVLFYSKWCPYCQRFLPAFELETKTCKEPMAYVRLDDNNNPLWDEYGIGAVPTVILFEDGKVSVRLDAKLGSGLNASQFKKWFAELKLA
jgi:thioredoxin 1